EIEFTDTALSFTICSLPIRIFKSVIPHTRIPVFLVECDSLYNRPGIYGNPDGYEDNDLRFFVLCKAAFEIMIALNIKIDIVSAHDYHTALLLPLLKLEYGMNPLFQHTKGALTIHNAQYQGFYEINRVSTFTQWDLSFKDIQSPFLFDNKFNALYTGINFADAIIAV
ncbi:MAG: glycogen/starch synthase, partial [Bacteroidota bacterium]